MSISSGPSYSRPGISDPNPQWNHTQDIYSEEEMEEEEEEEEVDELASASEAEEEEASGSGGGQDPGRISGHTLLPTVRIENILQADGVTGNMSLSKEGLFLLSIATEEFIKRLAQGGHRQANVERRNIINYTDMADTTRQYQEFMFLRDIIPAPLSLAGALELREAKAKDFFGGEEVPVTTSAAASTSQSLAPAASTSSSKTKSKSRSTNGKEKANGISSKKENSSGSSRGQTMAWEGQGAGVLDARPWTHWSEPHTQTTLHQEMNGSLIQTNGHAPISSASQSGSVTPTHTADAPDGAPVEGWNTGPASGFLQGPGRNPGRTIYSQQTHS